MSQAAPRRPSRWVPVLATVGIVLFAGCGSGTKANTSATTPTTVSAPPRTVSGTFIWTSGPGLAQMGRDNNTLGSQCGELLLPVTLFTFEKNGKVSVTDRSAKLLGDGTVDIGTLRSVSNMPNGNLISQTCAMSFQVRLFEPPADLTTFRFEWPGSGAAPIDVRVERPQVKDGMTIDARSSSLG